MADVVCVLRAMCCSDKVVLLHLEQNDTQPLTPFNETVDALGTFAQNESELHDFAGLFSNS